MTMALGLSCPDAAMEDNGGDTAGSGSTGSAGNNSSGTNTGKRVVNVCSWGEYIDTSLIDEFEEKTGIEVNYQTAESNEALYSTLALGGANYDVIVPSDYMISQLIEEGMLQELDYSKIPNFEKIDPRFRNLSYDPENLYTVPYTWGTLGIIYNTTMVDEPITSWSSMFDEKYADNVVMIRNSRDAWALRCTIWATPSIPLMRVRSVRPISCWLMPTPRASIRHSIWTRSSRPWSGATPLSPPITPATT